MLIKPLPTILQIQPDEAEEKTKSGIFVGEKEDIDKPQTATILEIGKKVKHCRKGDRIFYSRLNLGEITDKDGKGKFFFIKEQDVIAQLFDD